MVKILVIEDDEAVRFALMVALQSMGHDVEFACNGEEGIEKCQEKTFELVITDLIMPQKDGLETTADLKRKWPDIKVILMSGGGKGIDTQEVALNSGATAFLSKPFTARELEDCIVFSL
ncbi:MAG: response regulator [Magnetovibrio sp.]|nr:response regulator [Magnetovibrio sp.]